MPSTIDYSAAREMLDNYLRKLEDSAIDEIIRLPENVNENIQTLFNSKTQSYREVALGCSIAKYFDDTIELSKPYVNLGKNSYNGRTLDEKVINPFLYSNEIPSSKGPYLATFRRSVKITKSIRNSQKDKKAYDSLLNIIEYLKLLKDKDEVSLLIKDLLIHFRVLRDKSKIEVARIRRLHLEQHKIVIEKLLEIPSGGLLPVLITVALLNTISRCYSLKWEIEWQGINESDSASGAGGDITINQNGKTICVIEITERFIDSTRVVSTFNSKIVRKGISDYLFILKNNKPTPETKEAATRYFAQGHEINFVQIHEWVWNNLATLGSHCRDIFLEELISLIDKKEISSLIKVKWNEIIRSLSMGN